MKNLFKLLALFCTVTALAAGVPEKHPTDTFQIGVGTSSSQKNFIFDLGLGASNPVLGVDTTLSGLNYSKNVVQWGDGTSSNKTFTANTGSGATNPKIIWDNTNSSWAFSNDGTNFSTFGSGSGGASGIQLLTNGDFESGVTLGWTNTGGTFASVSSGANLLVGKKSATFLASAGGQSVQSSLYTIPNGLTGQSCAASIMYKGGDVGLTFQVLDNSSNILTSQIIQTSTSARTISLPFQCPASGSVRLKVLSNASAALIALDQAFLGSNTLLSISQASIYGQVSTNVGTCSGNWGTNGATFATLQNGVTGCTYTASGNATAPSSVIPAIKFASLPPGRYVIDVTGSYYQPVSAKVASYAIYDGTNYSVEQPALYTQSDQINVGSMGTYSFNYATAQSNITFELQGKSDSGGAADVASTPFTIKVYRFPTESELAVRPETINWNIEATQTNTNINLGTAVATTTQFVEDATNTLTINNYGTLSALEPCSGTGSPVASTTCSSSLPQMGIVFTPPAAGKVKVCSHFNIAIQSGGAPASVYDAFYMKQTAANNQATVLATGVDVSTITNADPSSSEIHGGRQVVCGDFDLTSTAQTAIRMYQHTIVQSNTLTRNEIQAGSNTGGGPSVIYWTVRPLTQNIPAPILVGQPVAFHIADGSPTGSLTIASGYNIAIWGSVGTSVGGFDTNGKYNSSTGEYTIPVAGLWNFGCALGISSNVSTDYQMDSALCISSSGACATLLATDYRFYDGAASGVKGRFPHTSIMRMMNVGDKVGCFGLTNTTGTWAGDHSNNFFEGTLIR